MRIRPAIRAGILLAVIATVVVAAQGAQAQTPAATCGACHAQEYDGWAASGHAHAAESQIYRALAGAASAVAGWGSDGCNRCHAPLVRGGAEAADGVSCEACHLIQRVEDAGSGNFSLATDGVLRSVKVGPAPHPVSASPLFGDALFCAACHEQYHPVSGVALQSTYTEWVNSASSHGGKTCQACHMAEASSGHAFGPSASDVAAKGEALARAIALEVRWPESAQAGKSLMVDVRLENTGAAHALPTGKPEGYEMWLEMAATVGGQTVFTETLPYGVVFADEEGNYEPRVTSSDAASLLRDHRLFPGRAVVERFAFVVPSDVRGQLDVEVRLMYRRTPAWLSDRLGLPAAPEVVVRRASAAVQVMEPPPRPTYVAPTPTATLVPTPTPVLEGGGTVEGEGWLGPFLLVAGLVLLGVAAWAVKARAV